jgi:hypothetical protein
MSKYSQLIKKQKRFFFKDEVLLELLLIAPVAFFNSEYTL